MQWIEIQSIYHIYRSREKIPGAFNIFGGFILGIELLGLVLIRKRQEEDTTELVCTWILNKADSF